jgi:hypothetical protein
MGLEFDDTEWPRVVTCAAEPYHMHPFFMVNVISLVCSLRSLSSILSVPSFLVLSRYAEDHNIHIYYPHSMVCVVVAASAMDGSHACQRIFVRASSHAIQVHTCTLGHKLYAKTHNVLYSTCAATQWLIALYFVPIAHSRAAASSVCFERSTTKAATMTANTPVSQAGFGSLCPSPGPEQIDLVSLIKDAKWQRS